jgi:hypothetical protein
MHFFTTAIAAATLLGSTLAVPAAEASKPCWSVTKWNSCGGRANDYSFTVKGAANGDTPAFTANCEGAANEDYAECTVLSRNGAAVPEVYAKVPIVTDPKDPNDNIPEVFVQTEYTNDEGCRFESTGHHYATTNCESTSGRKFPILNVQDTAVC